MDKPYDHIISRKEWGAAPPRAARQYHNPHAIVIHHSVYPTLSPRSGIRLEAARMRTIQSGHFNRTPPFADIGYHLVIFPSGRVYRGRPLKAIGAHVDDHNTGRVGICFDGNFETGVPTQASLRTLRYLLKQHPKLKYMRPVLAHRDFGGTACPGRHLLAITNEF